MYNLFSFPALCYLNIEIKLSDLFNFLFLFGNQDILQLCITYGIGFVLAIVLRQIIQLLLHSQ